MVQLVVCSSLFPPAGLEQPEGDRFRYSILAVGHNRLRAIQATIFITPKPAAQACEVSFLPRSILASRQWYGKERPGDDPGRRHLGGHCWQPGPGHANPGLSPNRSVKHPTGGAVASVFWSGARPRPRPHAVRDTLRKDVCWSGWKNHATLRPP